MKPLKVFILLLVNSTLLLLPKVIVNACGFITDPEDYRFSLLQPDLANKEGLTPFFFSSHYLYNFNPYAQQDYVDQNNLAWYNEVNHKATIEDIDSLLNNTSPGIFFESNSTLLKNSFYQYLRKPQNSNLYAYISLSKKVEEIWANPDPWGEREYPIAGISGTINEAKELYRKTTSSFIKLRTAYQLIRLYSCNGQYENVAKTYDSFIEPVKTDSWIKTAALFQKAMTDTVQGNYLLSKVFDRGNYNKVTCLIRFHKSELDNLLKQAKSEHEKTVLRAMYVFNNPGKSLTNIENIYNSEPTYKDLSFLILREINKVEDWLLTEKLTNLKTWDYDWVYYAKASNLDKDRKYAISLSNFIVKIINDKKNGNQALYHLYESHLAMLGGNYSKASYHLSSIKNKTLPLNIKTQIRINKALISLLTESPISDARLNEIAAIVAIPNEKSGVYQPDRMKNQLILFAGRKMIENGDKARGLLLLGKTDRALGVIPIGCYRNVYQEIAEIASPPDYDKMLSLLDKKHKTKFEKFVCGKYLSYPYYRNCASIDTTLQWNKNKLLDCKATWYIWHNDLLNALNVLNLIPDSFWKEEPYATNIGGDPFYVNTYSNHRISDVEKVNYNKRQVIKNMLQLYRIAAGSPSKSAECYYKIGNAWFNMTYYGKNWLMMQQWWSSGDLSVYNNDIKKSTFNEIYLGCSIAKQFYLKAFIASKEKQLSSLACHMLGECNDNYCEYEWLIKNSGKKDPTPFVYPKNPFIKTLKKKGVSDKFYNEMIEECKTYASYIQQYNRAF